MKAFILKHKIFSVLLIIVLLSSIIASTLVYSDRNRHAVVRDTIEALQVDLENANFGAMKTHEGCGRTQTKSGEGAKFCSLGLEMMVEARSMSSANKHLQEFHRLLSLGGLHTDDNVMTSISDRQLSFHSYDYTLPKTGTSCGVSYRYDESKNSDIAMATKRETPVALKLRVSCDDTSWFLRNILNNTIY